MAWLFKLKDWETWPPEGHKERLESYARYRALFMGRHNEVYARVQRWLDREADKGLVYVVCNFAKLISLVGADMLFGEQPRFIVGDKDSQEQQALDRIIADNGLHTLNYESALSASWRGDAVVKVRYGRHTDWSQGEQAIIEAVPARIFFPEINPDNVRDLKGATLAWTREAGDKKYLRKEIHQPGLIRNELWQLKEGNRLGSQVKLSTLPEYAELPEEQEAGYPGLLVEYLPNWRLDDDFWGISDYVDLESLFDELNNRISRISRVLDKHESPKLILPPGIMKYDPSLKRFYVEKEYLDVVEVDSAEAGDLPKYLVWDAQLEAAYKQIDKLVEFLFLFSETSPDAFGLAKQGQAESGRALKFRLLRTLAKVNRKKLYFDQALKNVLYAAMYLEHVHGKGPEPVIPRIEWADGLPQDPLEAAEVESARMGGAPTTSLESAVRRLDGLSGQDLDDEVSRIRAGRPELPGGPEERPRITLSGAGEE